MAYFQYLVDHVEPLAKLVTYFVVSCVVFIGAMKRIYFNHRYKSPKRVIKLIMYLKKHDKYLNEDDMEYIRMRVNDEIMRDITKIPSAYNRKDLIYIFNNIEKKPYINGLYKLQNYIEKEDGHFCVRVKYGDCAWVISRVMAFLMGWLFFIFIMLGAISVFENKTIFTNLVFLLMAVVLEFAGLWMFSTFPTRKAIERINVELAKIRAPD